MLHPIEQHFSSLGEERIIKMFGMFNGTFCSPSGTGYIPEMEQTISHLERGTRVTQFFLRKKPEEKVLAIRRETGQIVWWPLPKENSKPVIEGFLDLRKIKEIRLGKSSKDFEKWADEARRFENLKCFVVYYGSEFKLRVLSVAGELIFPPNSLFTSFILFCI